MSREEHSQYVESIIYQLARYMEAKISRNDYILFRKEVDNIGQLQLSLIERVVHAKEFNHFIKSAQLTRETVIRILGFGHLQTSYFLSHLDDPAKEKIKQMGAIASLVVSLYDHLVDQFPLSSNPLTPKILLKARDNGYQGFFYTKNQKIMFRLVRFYFRQLKSLCLERNQVHMYAPIVSLIFKMYGAERACVGENPSRIDCLRKSAMPFVIIGIAAWLNMNSPVQRWRHLLWMYRVGSFFGVVDDLIDYEIDSMKKHANQFITREVDVKDQIARRIIQNYEFINHQWKLRNEGLLVDDALSRDLIAVCTLSWLGGYSQ